MLASRCGHTDVVRELARRGADVNLASVNHYSRFYIINMLWCYNIIVYILMFHDMYIYVRMLVTLLFILLLCIILLIV